MSNLPAKIIEDRIDNFRVYYNNIIYPELIILERKRIRLILFLGGSILGMIIVGYLTFAAHIPALSLFLWIPITLYASYLGYKIRMYKYEFKPIIVNLILEFIEEGITVKKGKRAEEFEIQFDGVEGSGRQIHYDFKEKIDVEVFEASGIFKNRGTYYHGEDYIHGLIGNVKFEMSELDVKKLSRVRPGFEQIFRGIFFHANFHTDTHSRIIILPKVERPFMMATIKGLTQDGGFEVKIPHLEFSEAFLIYSDNEFQDQQLLSEEVYNAILKYKKRTKRDIYVAFDHKHIYIAIANEKDILEPKILTSNLKYKLVKAFFDELMVVIEIVEHFDWQN